MKKTSIISFALVLVVGLAACAGQATEPPEMEELEEEIEVVQPAVVVESATEDAEDYTEQVADEQEPALGIPEHGVAEEEPSPVVVPDVAVPPPNAQAQPGSVGYDTPAAVQTDMGLMENFVLSHYFPSAGIDWQQPITDPQDMALLAGYINSIVVVVPGPDEFWVPFVGGPPLELSFYLDGVPQTYGIWHSAGGHEWFPPGRVAAYRIGDPPNTFLAVDERIRDVLNRHHLGR